LGAPAASPAPAALGEGPAWEAVPTEAAPAWSRSAQWSAGALAVLALALLAYHGISAQRWASRPTTLERNALKSARLDINSADHAQLRQLPGVGDGLAQRIIAYREQHNGFRSVEDLRQVKGIGPAILEQLRPFVQVEAYDGEEGSSRSPVPAMSLRTAAPVFAAAPPVTRGPKPLPTSPINVNRASAVELQRLPGIGPALSKRIIEAREQRPFASVDELRRVRGIGAKTLERIRPYVTVGAIPKAPPP
jgi:competence protein ComEA